MLMGCQTPSKWRYLEDNEKTTEYRDAVNLYNSTGRTVLEWQEMLLSHMLAKDDDGLWVYSKFGYSVPRRNGKSEVLGMREMQGLFNGEKILHTAHRTSTSHNAWMTLCRMLNDAGYVDKAEIPKKDIDDGLVSIDKLYYSKKANGLESVELIKTGGSINFRTRTTKGGLGEGFDLLVIDEAQEYMDDQESSLKYTVSDSKNGQTIMCGTPPTMVSSGTVFVKYRDKCLKGELKHSGWAEWSVEEMTDVYDREAWVQCNPSLGHVLTERAIEDEIGDDDSDFNIQRLGLWMKYNQKSAITSAEWSALKLEEMPEFSGKLHVGVKFGRDSKNISISIATKTNDGRFFVEGIYHKPLVHGIGWLIEFLSRADFAQVVCDGKAGKRMIEDAVKEYKLKNVLYCSTGDFISANVLFEQAIFNRWICHMGQPHLHDVITNCKKKAYGTGGGFGYEALLENLDISIMESAILAIWSCSTTKERKKQTITY